MRPNNVSVASTHSTAIGRTPANAFADLSEVFAVQWIGANDALLRSYPMADARHLKLILISHAAYVRLFAAILPIEEARSEEKLMS